MAFSCIKLSLFPSDALLSEHFGEDREVPIFEDVKFLLYKIVRQKIICALQTVPMHVLKARVGFGNEQTSTVEPVAICVNGLFASLPQEYLNKHFFDELPEGAQRSICAEFIKHLQSIRVQEGGWYQYVIDGENSSVLLKAIAGKSRQRRDLSEVLRRSNSDPR